MDQQDSLLKVSVLPIFEPPEGERHIGLINHPKVGWQIISGTGLDGESAAATALRELEEETGLALAHDALTEVGRETTPAAALREDFRTQRFTLPRGTPVAILAQGTERATLRYTEYVGEKPEYEIQFAVPRHCVAAASERFFFRAKVARLERLAWQHASDGHEFTVTFFPLSQLPPLAPAHRQLWRKAYPWISSSTTNPAGTP